MGLVYDSSSLIRAERSKQPVAEFLRSTLETLGDQRAVISAVALVELVHGIYRANTPELQARRKSYIEEFLADVPVYPLTKRVAFLAGQIDAEQKSRGISIPFQDLLIGATALQLSFAVVTLNVRHFQLIPNLKIFEL